MYLLLGALGCDRSEHGDLRTKASLLSEIDARVDPAAELRVDASTCPACPPSLLGRCCARHHFASPPEDGCPSEGCPRPGALPLGTGGQCPPNACGVNGTWLGEGVPFRTLTFDGNVNDQQVQFVRFEVTGMPWPALAGRPPIGTELAPHIDFHGDELYGNVKTSTGPIGPILRGRDLIGTTLVLSRLNYKTRDYDSDMMERITNYALTIVDVITNGKFFVKCQDPYQCDDRAVTFYKFVATTDDGCAVDLCRPGLIPDDSASRGLAGMAVIFQGERYDPDTLAVTTAPDNEFNIACVGTALSKLHLFRHTAASQSPRTPLSLRPSPQDQQTMLRLLTADYCGTEQFFTHNGVKIKIGLPARVKGQNNIYSVTPGSEYAISQGDVMEATWAPDGAHCLDTPRLGTALLPDIVRACGSRFCSSGAPCPAPQPCTIGNADYISAIPP
jgi:hypothetical protein